MNFGCIGVILLSPAPAAQWAWKRQVGKKLEQGGRDQQAERDGKRTDGSQHRRIRISSDLRRERELRSVNLAEMIMYCYCNI